MRASTTTFVCDFCGIDHHKATRMVRGLGDVCICDKCVGLSADIVAVKLHAAEPRIVTPTSLATGAFEATADGVRIGPLVSAEEKEYLAQRDKRTEENVARWKEQEKTTLALNAAVASFALAAGLQSRATS